MAFRVGDKVKYKEGRLPDRAYGFEDGKTYDVRCVSEGGSNAFLFAKEDVRGGGGQICPCGKHKWVEQENDIVVVTNSNMSTLKQKFALAFKSEPEKSFIKAGVMNTDESLTEEGKEVFMRFLLTKHKDAFKTEVVDPILAEDKDAE